MSYPETLRWLFAQARSAPRDPARMRALTLALELALPPKSVHVVGSNGKGGTSRMIAAGLSASGLRTGQFISPHVEDFCERVSVDGVEISPDEVVRTLERWRSLGLPLKPGFFEWTFALALEHFFAHQIDIAVVEAGIGAKRDVTLILEPVALAVLTNVSLEHQAVLGPTLRDIARDKAEAVRPGVPVITGAEGEALEVVRAVAGERGSPLHPDDGQNALFTLPEVVAGLERVHRARYRNARLAGAALRLLGASEDAVLAGVTSPPLPGRREVFSLRGCQVILDGAHNPAASEALLASLEPGFTLLFGALPRKQGEEGLRVLEPFAKAVFITDVSSEPSSLLSEGRTHHREPLEALEAALEATPPGGTLVVTGSFYLVGELRPWVQRKADKGAGSMTR